MKFLLDACVAWRTMQEALENWGHDVVSAQEKWPNASDEALLARAYEEKRVLVTRDKDFGELAVFRGHPHACIVRLAGLNYPSEQVQAMQYLISQHEAVMQEDAIVVVTGDRVRIRLLGPNDG